MQTTKKVECKHCGGSTFAAEVRHECEECEFNGYAVHLEDDDYVWEYDESKRDGREREEAFETTGCKIGDCYGGGCMYFTCKSCGKPTNVPYTRC